MSEENRKYDSTLYTCGDPVAGIQPSTVPNVVALDFTLDKGESITIGLEQGLPQWCTENEFEVQLLGKVSPDGETYSEEWYSDAVFNVFFITAIHQGTTPYFTIKDRRDTDFMTLYKVEEFSENNTGAEWFMHPIQYRALIKPIKTLNDQYSPPFTGIGPDDQGGLDVPPDVPPDEPENPPVNDDTQDEIEE